MTDLKSALEAVLFASGESVPTARLSLAFAVEQEEISRAAEELAEEDTDKLVDEIQDRGDKVTALLNQLIKDSEKIMN